MNNKIPQKYHDEIMRYYNMQKKNQSQTVSHKESPASAVIQTLSDIVPDAPEQPVPAPDPSLIPAVNERYPEPDISEFTEPKSKTNSEDTGIGRLRITATSGNRASPIEDVLVTVTRSGEESPELLALLLTDSSGSTQTLEISAPPEKLSDSPTDERVSALVDITAYKKGYYEVTNRNVSVFSGITSIQPVNMIPLPLGSPPQRNVFTERTSSL